MAPRWVIRLLSLAVPEDQHDDVIGDLEELHARRLARWGRLIAAVVTSTEGVLASIAHFTRRVLSAALGSNRWISAVEVRLALRLMRKQPVMTLTSVVALGLGIAIVAGAFSLFQQVLYGELPFSDGDRWVVIETYAEESRERLPLDLERLRSFRESAPAFVYIGASGGSQFNVLHENGEIERIAGARITPGTFEHLPYVPTLGRLFVSGDGMPNAEPVALIRESLWERRFFRSPDVLGQPVGIAGDQYLIVGVLPDGAGYPADGEIWVPIEEEALGATDDRAPVGSRLVGILAEGATTDQAAAQLSQLSARVSAPGRGAVAQRHEVTPVTRTLLSPQVQIGMTVFMTILMLVFLVISANVANLVVARTSRRAPELAVRTALGASRARLIGQLFVEVLVLGVLAAVLGLFGASGILGLYDRVLDELPFWVDLHLDPMTAVVVAVLALLAAGVMGVIPALRATRKPPGDSLRAAGRGGSLSIGVFGRTMIAAEVALSVMLLGIAVLFAKGFQDYMSPAFQLPDDRVLTATLFLDLDASDLKEGGAATVSDSSAVVIRHLSQSMAAMPGVNAVSTASSLPRISPIPEPMELEGRAELIPTAIVSVAPGMFSVFEVEPILGREFEESDVLPAAPSVVVVNESFAVQNYGTNQVLGRRVRLAEAAADGEPARWREIVGVVPNVMEVVGSANAAGVYYPITPREFLYIAINVDSDPLTFAAPLRRAAYDLDPRLNVANIVRLDDVGAENRVALGAMSSAMTGLGVMTLLLSLAGVFSIVSLTVTQRTREIGVRVALGATPLSIIWSLLRRLGLLVVAGAVVGALAGYQASKVRLFVFAIPEGQWWLFPALVALMGAAGAVACWMPARRALAIQPVEALKADS